MEKGDYDHFVCIVAGDNPEELIRIYQAGTGDTYNVKYYFKDASKLKRDYVSLYENLIKKNNSNSYEKIILEEELKSIKEDNDVEFFYRITEEYEHDPKTGDAITKENPNAKFTYYNIGKSLSIPFTLNDGSEAFQAKKKNIKWTVMHMANTGIYIATWEMVIEGKKPSSPIEETIYSNMKDMQPYLKKFGTKDNYVTSSCAFWGYAFLSKETGWQELEPNMNQFKWVSCFFEKFIIPLQEETLLTIYECRK